MTVNELIGKLEALSDDDRELPVAVQDGMDPSDWGKVSGVKAEFGWLKEKVVKIWS